MCIYIYITYTHPLINSVLLRPGSLRVAGDGSVEFGLRAADLL